MSNFFWPHEHGISQARILDWIAISFAKILIRSNQITVLLRSSMSLLICLLDLSVSDRGELRSSIIKVNCSISSFSSIGFASYILTCLIKKKIFQSYFLWFLVPCQKLQFGIYMLKLGKAQLLCFGIIESRWVCFCYLLCWAMLSHFMCPTLCDPMDCSPPGSSVLGIFQVRALECVVMPSSRGSSQSRDELRSLALQVDSLTLSRQGSSIYHAEYGIWKIICRNNLKS